MRYEALEVLKKEFEDLCKEPSKFFDGWLYGNVEVKTPALKRFLSNLEEGSTAESAVEEFVKALLSEQGIILQPKGRRRAGVVDYYYKDEQSGRVVDFEFKPLLYKRNQRWVYNKLDADKHKDQISEYLSSQIANYLILTNGYDCYFYSVNSLKFGKPFKTLNFVDFLDKLQGEGSNLIRTLRKLEEGVEVWDFQQMGQKFLGSLKEYYQMLKKAGISGELSLKFINALLFARSLEDSDAIAYGLLRNKLREYLDTHGDKDAKKIVRLFLRNEIDENLWDYYDTELFSWTEQEKEELYKNAQAVLSVMKDLFGIKQDNLYLHGLYSYDFRTIDEDVLGSSYETFLTEEEQETKKTQGIFYTPLYISEYVVESLLSKVFDPLLSEIKHALIDGDYKKVEEKVEILKKIKVLDPACGSGSFLVKVYKGIWRRYMELLNLINNLMKNEMQGGTLYDNPKKHKELSQIEEMLKEGDEYEFRKKICERHIYGIDKDSRAVRIAKLNIWKEMLRLETSYGISDLYKLPRVREKGLHYVFPSLKRNLVNADTLLSNLEEKFDIIIGNPPYVSWGNIDEWYRKELEQNFGFNDADLYVYFVFKAIQLLKENGYIGFIVSNKWMRAGYGQVMREKLLSDGSVVELIDFTGYKVFKKANVDTCILIWQKGVKEKTFIGCQVEGDFESYTSQREPLKTYLKEKGKQLSISGLTERAFLIAEDKKLQLKEKIEKVGKPLKDWDVEIYYGIKTGFNEAFIIDTDTRNEILRNCKDEEERKRTKELIKPVLRGENIDRYCYKWAGKWLIGTFPALKINIEEYPALKKYFLDNFDIRRLEQSGKKYPELGFNARKKTSNKWFETQDNIAYYQEFEKEKIVWKRVAGKVVYSLVTEKYYLLDSTFFITGKNLKYIMAVANSSASLWWMKYSVATLGKGMYGAEQYIKLLPIPPITGANQDKVSQIEELVDKILSIKKEQGCEADTSELERQIDQLVYDLYGLTANEIELIENEVI